MEDNLLINFYTVYGQVFLIFIFTIPAMFSSIFWITDLYYLEEHISIWKKIYACFIIISCFVVLLSMISFNSYIDQCKQNKHDAEILYYSGTTNAPNKDIQLNLDLIVIENIKTNK